MKKIVSVTIQLFLISAFTSAINIQLMETRARIPSLAEVNILCLVAADAKVTRIYAMRIHHSFTTTYEKIGYR